MRGAHDRVQGLKSHRVPVRCGAGTCRWQSVINLFSALLERSLVSTLSVLRKKISMLAIVITPARVASRDLTCMKGTRRRARPDVAPLAAPG